MFFQFITIDTNQLLDFASGNPFQIIGRLFVIGGWIPFTIVCLWGLKEVWLMWRQNLFAAKAKYVLLAIDVPKENEQLPKAVENVFTHIHGASASVDFIGKWRDGKLQPTFSFEICSHGGYVQFYVRTEVRFRDLVESAIFSQYPDAEINEVEDYASPFKTMTFPPKDGDALDLFGSEFKLKNPDYFPIRTHDEFEEKLAGEYKDPLGTMLESLSKIRPEEQVWLQILATTPNDNDWKKAGEKYIKKMAGIKEVPKPNLLAQIAGIPIGILSDAMIHGSVVTPGEVVKKKDDSSMFKMLMMTPDTKATMEGVAEKIAKPGFNCKIRIVYIAPKKIKFIPRIYPAIKGSLNQFNALGSNAFTPYIPVMTQDDYFWLRWTLNDKKRRMLSRYASRSGDGAKKSVLNVTELATIWHFPIITTKAPLVKKTESRRAEPPAGLPQAPRELGGMAEGEWSRPKRPVKPVKVEPRADDAGPAVGAPPPSIPFV
jgi:hypothetical protein